MAAEREVLQACPSLEPLEPRQVRFVLLYTQADSSKVSMQDIAEQVGISRAQAHRWRNDETVQMAMAEVCQRLCDHSCRRLSAAAMYLMDDLANRLRKGTRELTKAEQYLLDLALRRSGVDAPAKRSMKMTDVNGNEMEMSEETGSLDKSLAELKERARETAPPGDSGDGGRIGCDSVASSQDNDLCSQSDSGEDGSRDDTGAGDTAPAAAAGGSSGEGAVKRGGTSPAGEYDQGESSEKDGELQYPVQEGQE